MKRPFESVIREHGPTVLRVCRVVLGLHDAEDAWSETFLSAMRAYPDLAGDANIEAWLVTIAHRKALDVVRSQRHHVVVVDELPERAATIAVSLGAHQELWDAVKGLSMKQRQAVAYHYVAGLPYRDVAEILGGTTDAARRAAADGIKSLRTTYLDVYGRGGH
ncbi:MAG TPA: RNA polymerase sigma factor [Acidimicrobiales bacterium]|nr:RNA polymerase sigma factor [Acidimicrobiales bacterium]